MEDMQEIKEENHQFEMEERNIGINGNKTFTDKFGVERPTPRVGLVEKFIKSYEDNTASDENCKKR